jgi:hypothetical protein
MLSLILEFLTNLIHIRSRVGQGHRQLSMTNDSLQGRGSLATSLGKSHPHSRSGGQHISGYH